MKLLYPLFLLASLILAVSTAQAAAEEADLEAYYGKAPAPPPQHPPPPYPGHKVVAPTPPPHPHPYPPTSMPLEHPCVTKCEAHCSGARKKRPCMKACTECCGTYHCVPGPYEKCDD